MSAEAIRYVLEHLPADEREQIESAVGHFDVGALIASVIESPPIYVLQGAEHPCAVGGMVPVGDGVWQAWAAVTDEARTPENLPRLTALCQRAYSDRLNMGAARVDVFCLANRHGVHRWYEAMGLKRAQELEAYGARGEPFVRYEVSHVLG